MCKMEKKSWTGLQTGSGDVQAEKKILKTRALVGWTTESDVKVD